MYKKNMNTFTFLLIAISLITSCSNLSDEKTPILLASRAVHHKDMVTSVLPKTPNLEGINISYYLEKEDLTSGEPVILNFILENKSNRIVRLDLGADRKEAFHFTAILPNGRRLVLPQLVKEGIALPGKLLIEPEQSYKQKLLLNEWIDLSQSGNYQFEVRLANSIFTGKQISSINLDSSFSIKIDQRNPERLGKVCSDLYKQLTTSETYADAFESATALSYVKDPIAVPYLQQALLSDKMVEPIIISGFERIGDKKSAQALINIANQSTESESASLAKYSLKMIHNKTSDAGLKEMIRLAITYK